MGRRRAIGNGDAGPEERGKGGRGVEEESEEESEAEGEEVGGSRRWTVGLAKGCFVPGSERCCAASGWHVRARDCTGGNAMGCCDCRGIDIDGDWWR